jgi:NAD(P)-dependent dehydrogenase (short-subunit alcohol dehydrogenase family)
MRLDDKIALITGGGKGIGRAIALAYAREGADVAICARTTADLRNVAAEVEKLGHRCFHKRADVTDKADAVAMVEDAMRELGRIDILVNNAGGGDVADHRTILEMDDKCWFDNIALNLHSTWYFTKAILPHMVERHGPTRAGWSISPTGIGKIAERFGMDVETFNARSVQGGAIKRMVEAEEVAELAVYFASDLSAATTGQSVSVCGGFDMH